MLFQVYPLNETFIRGGKTDLRLLFEMECNRPMVISNDLIIPVSKNPDVPSIWKFHCCPNNMSTSRLNETHFERC